MLFWKPQLGSDQHKRILFNLLCCHGGYARATAVRNDTAPARKSSVSFGVAGGPRCRWWLLDDRSIAASRWYKAIMEDYWIPVHKLSLSP